MPERAPAIAPTFEGGLDGVAAISASDAWAVGSDGKKSLILRWHGAVWRKVPSPSPAPSGDSLDSVAATAASNAWAVGGAGVNALVFHWNAAPDC